MGGGGGGGGWGGGEGRGGRCASRCQTSSAHSEAAGLACLPLLPPTALPASPPPSTHPQSDLPFRRARARLARRKRCCMSSRGWWVLDAWRRFMLGFAEVALWVHTCVRCGARRPMLLGRRSGGAVALGYPWLTLFTLFTLPPPCLMPAGHRVQQKGCRAGVRSAGAAPHCGSRARARRAAAATAALLPALLPAHHRHHERRCQPLGRRRQQRSCHEGPPLPEPAKPLQQPRPGVGGWSGLSVRAARRGGAAATAHAHASRARAARRRRG